MGPVPDDQPLDPARRNASAEASRVLQRASGDSIPARWIERLVIWDRMSSTPEIIAGSWFATTAAWACFRATREAEHAVSTLKHAPWSPNRKDILPATTLSGHDRT